MSASEKQVGNRLNRGRAFTDQNEIHVLELPKFDKRLPDLGDDLDKWLYFLRHAATLDVNHWPPELAAPPSQRAGNELNMLAHTDIQREIYEARHKTCGGKAMKTKQTKRQGKPDPAVLADIVDRVVRAATPERIVLFGSAARGEMGPDSDVDLLVIKGGKFDRDRVTVAIYRALRGKGAPVDIVVVTPEEVERYRDTHCLVICPALEEGKVVYDSKTPSAGRSA